MLADRQQVYFIGSFGAKFVDKNFGEIGHFVSRYFCVVIMVFNEFLPILILKEGLVFQITIVEKLL